MVDLVKIRKKAKGKKEKEKEEEAAPIAEQPPVAPPETPQPEPAAESISKLERFKQEAGRRREVDLFERESEVEEQARVELLTFVIAGEQYAIEIEHIVEIVTPRPVTRVPNADPSVVGILSLRGTIVALVDVRRKLRHPAAAAPTEETRIVVIDFDGEMIGFVVDRVLRVVKALPNEIEPHPVVHATELDASIRGVFRPGGALTILLDLDKLLDSRGLAASMA
ncbi:MAG TPA: chemotaxis protein CheW [Thermoanaerobaculia bacterium]|jgi:purine-binding chemotaxis protein CheW